MMLVLPVSVNPLPPNCHRSCRTGGGGLRCGCVRHGGRGGGGGSLGCGGEGGGGVCSRQRGCRRG